MDPTQMLEEVTDRVMQSVGEAQQAEMAEVLARRKQKRDIKNEAHLYLLKFLINVEEVDQHTKK
uniref:TFIIS central domain-containing protein n=1 Tax=Ascaris lumbricoides TaxID=6252 RepID=A0A0M3I068_ASCLU